MSNYATKADLKNAIGIDTLDFAKKTNLANLKYADKLDVDKFKNVLNGLSCLKSKVHKLDIERLETSPVNLIKLINVVENVVVKKTEYNELVEKVHANTTDTSDLVKKADYNIIKKSKGKLLI